MPFHERKSIWMDLIVASAGVIKFLNHSLKVSVCCTLLLKKSWHLCVNHISLHDYILLCEESADAQQPPPLLKWPDPPSESGHPLLGGRPTLSRCLIYFRQKETTGEAKKRWSLVKKFNISRKHFSAKSLSTKKNVHVGKCKCKWIVASGNRPRMSWHYCFPLNGRSLELLTLSAAFPDAPEFALTGNSLPHQDSCLNISRRDKAREFSSCSI